MRPVLVRSLTSTGRNHPPPKLLTTTYIQEKYVALRLNYHHMQVKQWEQADTKKVNALQLRVQYMF